MSRSDCHANAWLFVIFLWLPSLCIKNFYSFVNAVDALQSFNRPKDRQETFFPWETDVSRAGNEFSDKVKLIWSIFSWGEASDFLITSQCNFLHFQLLMERWKTQMHRRVPNINRIQLKLFSKLTSADVHRWALPNECFPGTERNFAPLPLPCFKLAAEFPGGLLMCCCSSTVCVNIRWIGKKQRDKHEKSVESMLAKG